MIIDLASLKRELHRKRMSMRDFFRRAKLSRTERACVLHGVRVLSCAVARICWVLDCQQDALYASLVTKEEKRSLNVGS